ncbi:hypothetical protein [Streptomyces sp. KR80]|uniref:hypothetical protein n=1 Tax=Streptomyces sp. KR80 TaxID=3457426 RepID=UPI003FD0FAAF
MPASPVLALDHASFPGKAKAPAARPQPYAGVGVPGGAARLAGSVGHRHPDDDRHRSSAGRRAGEGRQRPGRPEASVPPHTADSGAPEAPSTAPSAAVPGLGDVPPSERPAPHRSPNVPPPPGWDELEAGRTDAPLPYEQEPRDPVWTELAEPPAEEPHDADAGDSAGEISDGQAAAQPTGPLLRVLPIGTGLALMGFGLGFIGIRLRQR